MSNEILKKFNQISMVPMSRIAPEDQAFVDLMQSQYDEKYEKLSEIFSYLKQGVLLIDENSPRDYEWGYEREIRVPTDLIRIKEEIKNKEAKAYESLKYQLIRNISEFFSSKYGCVIKYSGWESNEGIKTAEDVVDRIIDQLGGLTFTEKAIQDIKEAAREQVKWAKITVKGKKVSFEMWVTSSYGYYPEFDYSGVEKIFQILRAVTHFDNGSTTVSNAFNYLRNWTHYTNITGSIYDKQSFEWMNKFEGFKIYKNHKFELEFKSSMYALEFAREYLGYQSKEAVA